MNTPVKDLKYLRKKLLLAKNEEKIEKILFQMASIFVKSELEIRDNIKIQPLWVESYYYNENSWKDVSSDRDNEQKNYLTFYFNRRGGNHKRVDITFSDGKQYLSFLLKYSLKKEGTDITFKNQSETRGEFTTDSIPISSIEPDKINYVDNKDSLVVTSMSRIGLTFSDINIDEKEFAKFKYAKIAAVNASYNSENKNCFVTRLYKIKN